MNDLALKEWARQDLGRYKQALTEVKHHQEKIRMLESKAKRYTRPLDPDSVPVQGNSSNIEEILVIIIDMKRKSMQMQVEAEKICREIELKISELSDLTYQEILRDHWCYGLAMWEIGNSMNYSRRHIIRLHGEALLSYAETWHRMSP